MASESTTTAPDGTRTVTIDDGSEVKTITKDVHGNLTSIVTRPADHAGSYAGVDAHGPFRDGEQMPPQGYFFLGVLVGALLLWAFQLWGRRSARRAAAAVPAPDRVATELDALRQRTAVLERLATDKPARLAAEIDGLR